MAPSHVLEPTYDSLRRQLLRGAWPAGTRLEAARLADDLGVSITPVRDSLYRLTGERLVLSSVGEGFRVPPVDEAEFRDLTNWHRALIGLVLSPGWSIPKDLAVPHGHDGLTERSALLFLTVASTSGSGEISWAVSNASARLARYRRSEEVVLTDVSEELDAIESALMKRERSLVLRLVKSYHRRRFAAAAAIIQDVRTALR